MAEQMELSLTTSEELCKIKNFFSYEEYKALVSTLYKSIKKGENEQAKITTLNIHRMNRLDKTLIIKQSIIDKLNQLRTKWIWFVLTEGWCGDAAQNVPFIAKMVKCSPNVQLRILLRDQHLNIMDRYLTNGTRSIPKLICVDTDYQKVLGTWGPRPQVFQKLVKNLKDSGMSKEELHMELHKKYNKDKGQALQIEFETLINRWSK